MIGNNHGGLQANCLPEPRDIKRLCYHKAEWEIRPNGQYAYVRAEAQEHMTPMGCLCTDRYFDSEVDPYRTAQQLGGPVTLTDPTFYCRLKTKQNSTHRALFGTVRSRI